MAADDHDADDPALFRKVMRDARVLPQHKVGPWRARRKAVPQQTLRDAERVMQSLLSDGYDPAEIETGEELLFMRPGLQLRNQRKFRRGEYAIQAELDLHGRIIPEARELVAAFLRDATARGLRCVRIIHGKGLSSPGKLPVLKNKVNAWLRQRDEVLAFASCRPVHGGTGAVYVLLKRG